MIFETKSVLYSTELIHQPQANTLVRTVLYGIVCHGVGQQAAVKMLMAESVTAVFGVKNMLTKSLIYTAELLLSVFTHLSLCGHLQSELMLLREQKEPLDSLLNDSL